ncbi:SGT1-like protein [Verticillium alfalfae VaMs.102]|uniref:SGT1-like protein n=1 Tax=Verticillium alfalfae (strain VaMs.102 / ATCC MYA-4576 / FGSC 10136) TaxID=526221 RepID=C9SXS6_VERA1|nr:SGT1-like protein [Verticillium alfalfae VaMs.102]EEY23591.1 SGT1-like protein [Verticillium alfalfae VaMs.102]
MADTGNQQNPLDGLDKRLPENCVEYLLFLVDQNSTDRRKELSKLEDVRKNALASAKDVASDYIWQRGEFSLEVKSDQGLAYVHGITDYGDSVEDEWLIVFLLRKLSLANPNLWIRIFDSDGEFLLIEAANVLPAWLNPEMDRNRAWLHQGKLHIIPLNDKGSNKILSLPDALALIRSSPKSLVQSDLIDAEAFYRLEKYPEQIANSLHHSLVTIPRKLALVLHEAPKAMAPAVEAFYLRDPIALQPFLSSSADLHFPPQDLVTVSATFTRVLFAQLRSQRFDLPQPWADFVQKAPDDQARRRLETGAKLACGFDMMVKRLDRTDLRAAREVGILLDDLREDGDAALPTDDEIKAWTDAGRDDDDAWLDINYEDFERELDGKSGGGGNSNGRKQDGAAKSGFGDATAQADLRKLVSRFESFLNDDAAGVDGAGDDDDDEMDRDNDTDSLGSWDDDSEDEDKAVSFDEEAFARMMREMMGLPSTTGAEGPPAGVPSSSSTTTSRKTATIDQDDQGIRDLAAQFEAELNEHGALKLDPTPDKKLAALKGKGKEEATRLRPRPPRQDEEAEAPGSDEDESTDGEMDIDYNLAKNLLESFKGQAGMAGPAGNMLGMMGMQLPRDEDFGDDDVSHAAGAKKAEK